MILCGWKCSEVRGLLRPVHANQMIQHLRDGGNCFVDPLRLPAEVRVKSANDDSRVICRSVSMQLQEVASIVRQQYSVLGD